MSDHESIQALISDLYTQVDQMKARGVKNRAGNAYNPTHYARGLDEAVDEGGLAVAAYVSRYIRKAPNDGMARLEDADALDLSCEWLVADEDKPYAALFTDEDRALARERLAPHLAVVEERRAVKRARIDAAREKLQRDGMPYRSHLDLAVRGRPVR